MKTLDEVIKAYEVCHASVLSCEGCPYDNGERYRDSDCYIADALFYLKEYRKLDSLDAVAFPEDDNLPLDWDELKAMEGKPVWVEERLMIDGKERHDNRWFLVGKVTDKYMNGTDLEAELRYKRCDYAFDFPEQSHWQAYRKERK